MKEKFDKLEHVTTASHLTTKDLACLVTSSRKQRTLFQPLLDERKLLHYVVRSEHDLVKAMLIEDINLLFKKSSVTDCSSRIFESISPFQYALWALDKYMWDLMISCIPPNEKNDRLLAQLNYQYNMLQTKGLTYRLHDKVITEPHFDFQNTIVRELQMQVTLLKVTPYVDLNAVVRQIKQGIGGAQRLFPVHVIHEYCSEVLFNPIPEFTSQPRLSEKFRHWQAKGAVDTRQNWYGELSALGVLGTDYAIVKGQDGLQIWSGAGFGSIWWLMEGVEDNLAAMKVLSKVRANDFINLGEQLEGMQKLQLPALQSHKPNKRKNYFTS